MSGSKTIVGAALQRALVPAAMAVCAAAALSANSASAQAVFSERDVVYYVDTTAGLNNTVTGYDNVITMPAGGGSSIGGTFSLLTGAFGMVIDTTGGVTTTFTVPPAGTPSMVGDVVNDGAGGTFHFMYSVANGPDFASSVTESETQFGHNVLHFSGGGTNFADIGAIFVDNIFLTGNWSAAGTSAGDHTGLTFDPSFNLINDFVYDPTYNWTLLTISTGNFQGGTPGINFFLVGDTVSTSVPEPSAWAMMLIGFAGVGFALRRRKVAEPANA